MDEMDSIDVDVEETVIKSQQSELMANFCSITNCDPDTAASFLEAADYNVEMAIGLFMEGGGMVGQSGNNNAAMATTSTTSSRHAIPPPTIIETTSASMNIPVNNVADVIEVDGASDVSFQTADSSNITSPPEFGTTLIRIEKSNDAYSFVRSNTCHGVAVRGRGYAGMASTQGTGAMADAFRSFQDDAEDVTNLRDGTLQTGTAPSTLSDLFRPPFDIMFNGTFEAARQSAKEQNRWLLTNLHEVSEFACQVTNRDLWSDASVKDLIRETFIFVQLRSDSNEGRRYSNFYPIDNYPHISIIDPRTGERVKVWSYQMSPMDFLQEVIEFMEKHSLGSNKQSVRGTSESRQRSPSEMTEDELISAAIHASLQKEGKSETDLEGNVDMEGVSEEEMEEMTEVQKIPAKDIDEPEPSDINATRIQIRMTDGSRVVRRFLKTTVIRDLFSFVKFKYPEVEEEPDFDILLVRESLSEKLDETFEEAKVMNAVVTIAT